MAKEPKCRACGGSFEKTAPAQAYCPREDCVEKRATAKKKSEAKRKAAAAGAKTAKRKPAAAKPKKKGSPPKGTGPDAVDPRAREALRLLDETITEREAALDQLYEAANSLATSLGLEAPYPD